jgi:hypothetical protein
MVALRNHWHNLALPCEGQLDISLEPSYLQTASPIAYGNMPTHTGHSIVHTHHNSLSATKQGTHICLNPQPRLSFKNLQQTSPTEESTTKPAYSRTIKQPAIIQLLKNQQEFIPELCLAFLLKYTHCTPTNNCHCSGNCQHVCLHAIN